MYFFFQAEDGIRDLTVTGVQTCALPISVELTINSKAQAAAYDALKATGKPGAAVAIDPKTGAILALASYPSYDPNEIGRASCRERVEISVVAGSLKKKKNKTT